jgi:hypothetical protein
MVVAFAVLQQTRQLYRLEIILQHKSNYSEDLSDLIGILDTQSTTNYDSHSPLAGKPSRHDFFLLIALIGQCEMQRKRF